MNILSSKKKHLSSKKLSIKKKKKKTVDNSIIHEKWKKKFKEGVFLFSEYLVSLILY